MEAQDQATANLLQQIDDDASLTYSEWMDVLTNVKDVVEHDMKLAEENYREYKRTL